MPCPDRNPATDPSPHPEHAPIGSNLTHPTWCHPRHCTAERGGPHRGPSVLIDPDSIGSAQLQLQLWSPADDPDGPVVLLELAAADRDSGRRVRVDLSMRQLDQLIGLLTTVTNQAGES